MTAILAVLFALFVMVSDPAPQPNSGGTPILQPPTPVPDV